MTFDSKVVSENGGTAWNVENQKRWLFIYLFLALSFILGLQRTALCSTLTVWYCDRNTAMVGQDGEGEGEGGVQGKPGAL